MRSLFMVLAFVAGLIGTASAESIDIGPAVGAHIPSPFHVLDSSGAQKTYADITGPKGTVLVFVRSADWCPYCNVQLRDIQTVDAQLKDRGYKLVSVSYDAPEVLVAFMKKYETTYMMASDKGSAMIDAFDIRDPQYGPKSKAFGVPKPAIFVVDQEGVVRAKLAEEGYKTRPPSGAIIEAIDSLKK